MHFVSQMIGYSCIIHIYKYIYIYIIHIYKLYIRQFVGFKTLIKVTTSSMRQNGNNWISNNTMFLSKISHVKNSFIIY